MLVEATIVAFVEVFVKFNPLYELVFKKPAIFTINTEVFEDQSANLFHKGVVTACLDRDFLVV